MKFKFMSQKARHFALDALEVQNGLCIYCDEPLTPETMTTEHIIPRSKGGGTIRGNIAACCRACNETKGNSDPFLFLHLVRKPSKPFHNPARLMLANYRWRVNRRVRLAEKRIRRAAA